MSAPACLDCGWHHAIGAACSRRKSSEPCSCRACAARWGLAQPAEDANPYRRDERGREEAKAILGNLAKHLEVQAAVDPALNWTRKGGAA